MSDILSIGTELKIAREGRTLSLRQVEQKIHIRAKFLEALENGQLDLLPASVQTRGFLRSYAKFLGYDGDLFVQRWDEAVMGQSRRRRAVRVDTGYTPALPPQRTGATGAIRVTGSYAAYGSTEKPRRSLLVLVGIGLIAAALFGGIVVAAVLALNNANRPDAGILGQVPTLPPTPTLTPDPITLTPQPPTPTPAPDAPPIKGATFEDVSLQLTILARTWLRVTVDGVVVYQGMPAPNTVLQYKGRTVTIRAANAIGLRAVVNGQDLGILGVRGQIVEETFTPNAPLGEAPPALPTSVAPATPAGTPTFDPAARG